MQPCHTLAENAKVMQATSAAWDVALARGNLVVGDMVAALFESLEDYIVVGCGIVCIFLLVHNSRGWFNPKLQYHPTARDS
jgi:hypothetical protein